MYEYRCPACQAVNTRHERMARLVCAKCGHEWEPGGSLPSVWPVPNNPWPVHPKTPPAWPTEPWITWRLDGSPRPRSYTRCSN